MVDAVAEEYVKGLLSGGEVVLIDTRQHWMAAVRFAMRPILLIAAVIVLFALNQWLQFGGGLSIINDIISWILIIMVVISVIWLPIDLVRWYSRKYVLTNRRAMRMSGVLKKKSFDSSLEQINDIGFVQSVFGRTFGYADLTLYTASDTANESYEQLRDGVQFKKAVLDAKEGIRHGQPLTTLPEGFIVVGGTNEASMRADGKLQEAAAQTGPMSAESVPDQVAKQGDPAEAAATEPSPAAAAEPVAAAEPSPAAATALASEPWPAADAAAEPVVEATPAPALVVEPEPAAEVPEPTEEATTDQTERGDSKPA